MEAQSAAGGPDGRTGPRKHMALAEEAAWGLDGRASPLKNSEKAEGRRGPDG